MSQVIFYYFCCCHCTVYCFTLLSENHAHSPWDTTRHSLYSVCACHSNNVALSLLHSCFLQNGETCVTSLTAGNSNTALTALHVLALVVYHSYKATLPSVFLSRSFHVCLSYVAQGYFVVFLKLLIALSMGPHGAFA